MGLYPGFFLGDQSWIYSGRGYIQSVNVGGILDIGTEGKGEKDHRGQEDQRGKMHWMSSEGWCAWENVLGSDLGEVQLGRRQMFFGMQ